MGMKVVNQTDAAINALPLGSGIYLIRPRSDKKDSIKGLIIVCNAASASFVLQRKLKKLVNGKQKSVRVGLGTWHVTLRMVAESYGGAAKQPRRASR